MAPEFITSGRIKNGLDYTSFMDLSAKKLNETTPEVLSEDEKHLLEYTKLNMKRSERVEKTYTVSEGLKEKLSSVKEPQTWMVVTEAWCGDSAQNLPYIAKMASVNPLINLKIVLRDQNLDIMDQYLSNGTRSIPILVSFDQEGNELFKWGPRPAEAASLVKKAKEEGKQKEQFIEELHLWYGRNRGKAIESEFISLLK